MVKLIAVPFSIDDLAGALEEYAQDFDKWKDPRHDDLMTAAAYMREHLAAQQPSEKPEPDADRGIYSKYKVTHADGRALDGDCFVLRPDRDPSAKAALRAYAAATPNKALAADILQWVGQPEPLALKELRGMGGEPIWIKEFPPYAFAGYKVLSLRVVDVYGDIVCEDGDIYDYERYGKTWLAFRSKPKEEV